jgi:3-phenylpropionate/cinnamic acid dioxygenase small subunit
VLSIEDRFAIQDLYARHNAFVDLGDYERWAACFSEDGVSHTSARIEGRQALMAHGKARLEDRANEPWTHPQHWNSNLIIEGEGRFATGLCYMIRIVKMKDTGAYATTHLGIYRDKLVKVGDTWLFKHRKLHLDAPPLPSAIPNPA